MPLRMTEQDLKGLLDRSHCQVRQMNAVVHIQGPAVMTAPAAQAGKQSGKKRAVRKPVRTWCPLGGETPQERLWCACVKRWPGLPVWEFTPIEGRRYRIDIAFPKQRIACEIDGWAFHGKFKSDFHRDRAKRNLLALHQWKVLAFPASRVAKDLTGILDEIQSLIDLEMSPQD